MKRLFLARAAVLAAACLCAPMIQAQPAYPDKTIRMIVPFPPGGSVDPIARVLARKLGEVLGQAVVVENRSGGNTSIGAGFVAKAPADGYTLFFTAAMTHVIHTLQGNQPYDSIKDFTPIAGVSKAGYIMVVHPSVPAQTLPEFISFAKANPGKLNYASSGIGNANHLAAEMLNLAAGIKMVHVPYKGGAQALLDLIAGRVHVMVTVTAGAEGHAKAGQLRALAYASEIPNMLPVPTFAHYGLQGFDSFESLNVLLAPAGTPDVIVRKLSDAVAEVLRAPDVKTVVENQQQFPAYLNPEQLVQRMRSDQAKYADILKAANISLTQ